MLVDGDGPRVVQTGSRVTAGRLNNAGGRAHARSCVTASPPLFATHSLAERSATIPSGRLRPPPVRGEPGLSPREPSAIPGAVNTLMLLLPQFVIHMASDWQGLTAKVGRVL